MALTGDIAHPSGHCPVPCAPGCSCLSSELGPEPHCGPFNLPHAVTLRFASFMHKPLQPDASPSGNTRLFPPPSAGAAMAADP